VKHAAPVQLREPGDRRHVVDDAGCDQELARIGALAGRQHDVKPPVAVALRVGDLDVAELDAVVLGELLAGDAEEITRRHTVAGEVAVHRV